MVRNHALYPLSYGRTSAELLADPAAIKETGSRSASWSAASHGDSVHRVKRVTGSPVHPRTALSVRIPRRADVLPSRMPAALLAILLLAATVDPRLAEPLAV